MMKRGEHLTVSGLEAIMNRRASMNRGLTPALKEAFPEHVPVERPIIDATKAFPIDPYWLAGFASGDGTFAIKLRVNDFFAGGRVELVFALTQHSRDLPLMKYFVEYLALQQQVAGGCRAGCGKCYTFKNHAEYICRNFSEIQEKILPFFIKYPIIGVKAQDFSDWEKALKIINSKAHLTKPGFEQIKLIKAGMNKGRNNV